MDIKGENVENEISFKNEYCFIFLEPLQKNRMKKKMIIFELRKSPGAGGGGAHRREQEQAEKKTKHFEIKISLKQNNQSNETKTTIRRAGSKTGCRRSSGS